MSRRGQTAAVCAFAAVSLLIGPLALAAGAGAPAPVGLTVIAGEPGVVGAGSSASFSARCPANTPHPIGGQFSNFGAPAQDQLALSASYPVGSRSWRVEITNLGQIAEGYEALVVCVGARGARFAYPKGNSVIAPGGTRGETVSCPRGEPSPLGGLFYLRGVAPARDAVVNWIVLVYKHRRLTSSATAGLRSLASAPLRFTAGVVCSNLLIAAPWAERTLQAGKVSGVTLTCPRGGNAIGGTFNGASPGNTGEITLAASVFESARKYKVLVRSLGTHSQRYFAGAVCVAAYLPSSG